MHEAEAGLTAFGVAWRLGLTLFFVALNGFFVAAEFALVKVRDSRVQELAEQGNSSAKMTQHMLGHMDRYLSGCQLGITLASLILGALGEPAVSRLLLAGAAAAGLTPAVAPSWLPLVSIGLAFAVITTLHMTVGEQAPKMMALQRAEGVALRTALILRVFTIAFWPFIHLINGLSNWMLELVGLEPGGDHEETHSGDEIRMILALSASSGRISDREQELAENVFRMIELEIRHIVVPRVDVEYLSLERDISENLDQIRASSHTRLPLCERDLDSIVGFVHGKDVLEEVLSGREPDLRALAREPLVVPDSMPLSDLLAEIQTKRVHTAAVVDEHGTIIGLVFREDVLEALVGPLGDEFDDDVPEFHELEPGVFELRGRMPLPEVCDRLEFALSEDEDEDQDTIGGHITARLHRLARKGDVVDVGPYRATIIEVSRRRVQRLSMRRRDATQELAEQQAPIEPA